MKVSPEQFRPAEVLAKAEAWYAQQLAILAQCHGHRWPEHREWVEAYLREQLRQRLIDRGWRPKQ